MERREFCVGFFTSVLESILALKSRELGQNENLRSYLKKIEKIYLKDKDVVKNYDVFSGFLNLDRNKQLTDYEIYYPLYKAGEISFRTPWMLLWLIHEQETRASIEPMPERSGYLGGMQRNKYFYPTAYVEEASRDWKFLEPLPQRYKKTKGFLTDDYQEILFASRKICEDSKKIRQINPNIDFFDSCLLAQFNYCNPDSAQERIDHFRKIYPLFLEYKRINNVKEE